MAEGIKVWDPNYKRDGETKVGRWIEIYADEEGRVVLSSSGSVQISGGVSIKGVTLDGIESDVTLDKDGSLHVSNPDVFVTQRDILQELKKISLYLSSMTDLDIKNTEVEA
jgi:hypothetical protein